MLPEPDTSLVPAEARILAAVSGGPDSMALLWWLQTIGRKVVAGHVNHDLKELRSGDCDRDEAFVRERCAAAGIPLHVVKVDLPRRNGHVHEEAARDARYAALIQIAQETNCSLIATGHTATDGLETALLNLIRGSGVRGLGGIPPHREAAPGITVVRPFWQLPRSATREMLIAAGWPWLEDASNTATVFRRNRVRHEVLPLLADISGQSLDAIAKQHATSSAIWRDDLEYLSAQAGGELAGLVRRRNQEVLILDGAKLLALPVALQRRCFREALRQHFGNGSEGGFAVTEEIRLWAQAGGRRKVWCRPGGVRIEWTGGGSGNLFRLLRARETKA